MKAESTGYFDDHHLTSPSLVYGIDEPSGENRDFSSVFTTESEGLPKTRRRKPMIAPVLIALSLTTTTPLVYGGDQQPDLNTSVDVIWKTPLNKVGRRITLREARQRALRVALQLEAALQMDWASEAHRFTAFEE